MAFSRRSADHARGLILAVLVRGLERVAPPPLLGVLLAAPATVITFLEFLRHPNLCRRLARHVRDRVRFNIARFAYLWPDRLGSPRWRNRIRIENVEALKQRLADRAVILATVHHGPIALIHFRLRSLGIPIASLVESLPVTHERVLIPLSDRATGLGAIPSSIASGRVRDVLRFLQPGRVLLMVVDGDGEDRARVVVEDRVILLRSGVFRLADARNATIVPCAIQAGPGCTAVARLGEPIPDEFVRDPRLRQRGFELLANFFAPYILGSRGQSHIELLRVAWTRKRADLEPSVGAGSASLEKLGGRIVERRPGLR